MRALSYIGYGDPSSFAPVFPDYVESVVLAANTAQRVAIPTGAKYVVFSMPGDFYAKAGASTVAAAVPGASTSDGSGAELNPAARRIPTGVTHISLIADSALKGSLSFYG